MKKIVLLDGTEVEAQLLGSLATALDDVMYHVFFYDHYLVLTDETFIARRYKDLTDVF